MDAEEKFRIISRRLAEIVGEDDVRGILAERDLKVYWGTAPTGAPHFGYFVPMLKIADLLRAGCEVTVLFADIHAVLDSEKSTFELVVKRTEYYKLVIKSMLMQVGVSIDKLRFVTGSDFQYSPEYTRDMYRLASKTGYRKARHAGADVVKQADDPVLSGVMYPLLQALDEQYLDVDAQFGGNDQRKIFMFARDALPRLGYKKRAHLMNPLVPGLGKNGKMSSSVPNSKIDFFDDDDTIRDKVGRAFSIDKQTEKNCLLAYLKHVIFPIKNAAVGGGAGDDDENFNDAGPLQDGSLLFIRRPERFGGDLSFSSADEVSAAFAAGQVCSADLKPAVAEELIRVIAPLRAILLANKPLYDSAYPAVVEEEPAAAASAAADDAPAAAAAAAAAADAAQPAKKRPQKRQPKTSKKKKKVDYGYHQYFLEQVELHKAEFPDLLTSKRKLDAAVRRQYQVPRAYHRDVPADEKLALAERWFVAHPDDRPPVEQAGDEATSAQ